LPGHACPATQDLLGGSTLWLLTLCHPFPWFWHCKEGRERVGSRRRCFSLVSFPTLVPPATLTWAQHTGKAPLGAGGEEVAVPYRHGTEGVFPRLFSPLSQVSKPLT